ncbi:MAG: TonB family protein [Acidobacteriota bacterium]
MEPTLELLEKKRSGPGVALAIFGSAILHGLLLALFLLRQPPMNRPVDEQMTRLVEIIRNNPQEHTEAPGPAQKSAPITAPLSNANRRASAPQSTGERPTNRPGRGGLYVPPGTPRPENVTRPQSQPAPQAAAPAQSDVFRQPVPSSPLRRDQTPPDPQKVRAAAAASGSIDWNSAIREVGKVASLNGDTLETTGGEEGFAENGPISFESQWYNWGDYADAMVRKIRRNWYANMPSLIRMGVKGVVTIRFTIQRDGSITDIIIIKSSDIPPFDFAAKKAIELSSPLQALPGDFPNATERVTAAFYYNLNPHTDPPKVLPPH